MIGKSLAIAVAAFAFAASSAQAAEKIQWRMNTWVPETSMLYQLFALPFVQRVSELTDGEVTITPYPTGVITPALKAHEAVLDGTADCVQAPPILLYGRDPTNAMFSVWPGGMGPEALMHWMYQGGGKELLAQFRREKMGLHSIPSGIGGSELLGHAHKPIRNASDLKGVKFRTLGAFATVLKDHFGAVPTVVPGPEVYTAMERKAIDAAEWSGPSENLTMALQETAKYIMYPGPQTNAFFMEFAIKAETWDKLPDRLKRKIEAAAKLATLDTMLAFDARDMEAWKKLKAGKNEIVRLDDALIEKFRVDSRALAMKIAAEEKAKGNPWMERVAQSYYASYDHWLQNAEYRHIDVKRAK
jgi:TRAP-type mannitol/chloroaromatic compound transport system substrate-binding protein